jgi:hypothetical protein
MVARAGNRRTEQAVLALGMRSLRPQAKFT